MTLEEMLSECCMGIEHAVCSMCSIENGWAQETDAIMAREFPEIWKMTCRTAPANDPVWTRFQELWTPYKTKCFYWCYDDSEAHVCIKHWKEIGHLLEEQ